MLSLSAISSKGEETKRLKAEASLQITNNTLSSQRFLADFNQKISSFQQEIQSAISSQDTDLLSRQISEISQQSEKIETSSIPNIQQSAAMLNIKLDQSGKRLQSLLRPYQSDVKAFEFTVESLQTQLFDNTLTFQDSFNQTKKHIDDLFTSLSTNIDLQNSINEISKKTFQLQHQFSAIANQQGATDKRSQFDTCKAVSHFVKSVKQTEEQQIPAFLDAFDQSISSRILTSAQDLDSRMNELNYQFEAQFSSFDLARENHERNTKTLEDESKQFLDLHGEIERLETENQIFAFRDQIEIEFKQLEQDFDNFQAQKQTNEEFELSEMEKMTNWMRERVKEFLILLQKDWDLFCSSNSEIQGKVNSELSQISELLRGKVTLLNRMELVERRAKWCADRLNVWKSVTGVDWNEFIDAERRLQEAEQRVEALDKEKVDPWPQQTQPDKFVPHQLFPKEERKENSGTPEKLEIPAGMKFTYPDDEPPLEFPELPPRSEKPTTPIKRKSALDELLEEIRQSEIPKSPKRQPKPKSKGLPIGNLFPEEEKPADQQRPPQRRQQTPPEEEISKPSPKRKQPAPTHEEEEETPRPAKKKRPPPKPEPENEEEEDESQPKRKPPPKKRRKAPVYEEEEEEKEPSPPPKQKRKPKPKPKTPPEEEDEEQPPPPPKKKPQPKKRPQYDEEEEEPPKPKPKQKRRPPQEEAEEETPRPVRKKKPPPKREPEDDEEEEEVEPQPKKKAPRKRQRTPVDEEDEEEEPPKRKRPPPRKKRPVAYEDEE